MASRRGRATYLVFDCIAINGSNYSKESLTDRLKRIRDLIVVPYRSAMDKGIIDSVCRTLATAQFSLLS